MGNLIRRRLPERLSGRLPAPLVEIGVGLIAASVTVAARMPFGPILGERAPYVFIFVAIVVASLLAGWRSGLVALVAGQILTWHVVIEPQWSIAVGDAERLSGFVVGTISQLLILGIIALYQREVDLASAEREERMQLLDCAWREIDHRTKNNYQTVLALIQMQAARARDPKVAQALRLAADRVKAVALAAEKLTNRNDDPGTVRLADHLRELCAQVERGLSHQGVKVECEVDDVNASPDKAIGISIIVNELITNALKHAFTDRDQGRVWISSHQNDSGFELLVCDDGSGMPVAVRGDCQPPNGSGLGSKLIERFVRQLGAKHRVSTSAAGTCHRILVPQLLERVGWRRLRAVPSQS
jgi:two-component system, sensor histidine kinase PdtaS